MFILTHKSLDLIPNLIFHSLNKGRMENNYKVLNKFKLEDW